MPSMTRRDADAPTPPFSAATRAANWATIQDQDLDLLIVGAGITGCGIALDAAGRGLRVAFVDADDFGSGTSSRSSRLIHGGLRYLETFDFRLVFEALAERRRLLELAPHLVRPLPFLFPVHRGVGPNRAKLAAGMWLYDTLALFRGVRRHTMLGRSGTREREPGIREEGLRGGAVYYDAQVDDARLTLAVARAAHEGGAIALPHARVTGFRMENGAIRGARLRDALSGEEKEVAARLVVAAAGPWTDSLRKLADPGATPRLRITKGVHIVIPAERVGNRGAIIFPSALDGRIMFVLPWGRFTYVGTTDTDFDGELSEPRPEREDVEYLLASANHLFPEARLTRDDVLSTWAGVRPLLAPAKASRGRSTGKTSREHEIWREPHGLLCVAGGKLTTYRPMAAEAAAMAAKILRREHGVESGDFYTEHVRLPGAPEGPWDDFLTHLVERAGQTGLSRDDAEHLAFAYGEEAEEILTLIEATPELSERLVPELPYLAAEVEHVIASEMPLTVEDVLRRRLHLTYEMDDAGEALVDSVARRLAEATGLDAEQIAAQREEYRRTASTLLGFRDR
jgi:glycerol-3-phosphate dehydrogenase